MLRYSGSITALTLPTATSTKLVFTVVDVAHNANSAEVAEISSCTDG